jgi:HAE1 family hydrophobic/amphiphilic exporter-1
MFSQFIHRPVLSIVISVLITLVGLLALTQLPITQFPDIAPPEVNVTTKFTGANAETAVKAVVTTLERAINGVPGMAYMSSVSGNDGVSIIQIIFKSSTNPDIAAVNVQNRVATVLDELPEEVIKAGVQVEKVQNSMLLYINILSNDSLMDEKFLYNFTDINILKELKRIDGVGFAEILGSKDYAMRVWLKPDKMLMYDISAPEIITTLKAQNVEAAPGKIGESSGKAAQTLQYVVRYTGKFTTEEAYQNIVLRSKEDGEILRLKDVADIDFDAQTYGVVSKENGKPSAAIMLKQRPGSNARQVINTIKSRMAEIKESSFSSGMDYTISYDVSEFLDASIYEVVKTLLEAFVLVALVVFLFLQDFRSTVIPILAVPVSLIGTFAFMQVMGFSLNLITLFALVLAIGIVVDNAIVVIEAVHAKLEHSATQHSQMTALQATEEAMSEISGAIIAITLVMAAVFVPVAFLDGPTGIFYRQFSLTMAVAIVLSGVTALTLTPALCALLLENTYAHSTKPSSRIDNILRPVFSGFNKWYGRLSDRYKRLLGRIAHRRVVTFGVLLAFSIGAGLVGAVVPSGFIPQEDQGAIYANVTTPSGATLERTERVVDEVQRVAASFGAVQSVSSLAGYSVLSEGTGSIYGMNLISLKNWDERKESDKDLMTLLKEKTKHIDDAEIEFFSPPPVPGYGNASGFELRLLDKTGGGDLQQLQKVANDFVAALNKRPEINNAFTTFNANFPQLLLHIDGDKAAQKGITADNAMSTLQTLIGSEYATNFIRFAQMYKVMVQALPEYRAAPEDLMKLYIKNAAGEMVPFSAFLRVEKVYGPEQITRYNMYTSAMINGEPAKGYSSGQAIKAIQEVAAATLPKGFGYDWAGSSRDQAQSGNQAIVIFVVCLLFVYLLLAAQYESFLLPLSVVLSLPVGVFGALFFLMVFGLENNIYAQIAIIMLIGILGKNAILIIEFAAMKQREGASPLQAALEGASDRLRPILMTSFAFIAGLIPLMLASGAGKIGNNTIGSAAAGGMLFGTVFGVVIIPGLYVVFASLGGKKRKPNNKQSPPVLLLLAFCGATCGVASSCRSLDTTVTVPQRALPEWYAATSVPTPTLRMPDTTTLASLNWRAYFQDSLLVALIDTALHNNFNLQMALQRVEVARANAIFTKGELLPKVYGSLGGGVRKFGLYTMDGAGNISTEILPGRIVPINLPDVSVGLQSSWEVDIWGKLRSKDAAANLQVLASVEGTRFVASLLVAEVATTYYELLALDNELDILRSTLQKAKEALSVIQIQKEAGKTNELAVQQFEAQVFNTQALEQETLQHITVREAILNALLGRFPQQIARSKEGLFAAAPAQIASGIPAQLLQNRPDIREAELLVQSTKFDVEAAKAAFFPSLNLTAGLGLQAFDPNLLLQLPASLAYSVLGGLLAPVFNQNALEAQFATAKANQAQALYAYQQSVVRGYVEVLTELSGIHALRQVDSLKSQQNNVLKESVEIATELYRSARATYLEVLVAQETFLEAQLERVAVKKRQRIALVNIYRALGGGWR